MSGLSMDWFVRPSRWAPLRKVPLFLALSAGDLALTWLLLNYRAGLIYEGNPLAAWCLRYHGWQGVTFLKATSAMGVCLISAILSMRHPRKGRFVLGFGCWVLGAVMVYSTAAATLVDMDASCPLFADVCLQARKLDRRCTLLEEYNALRQRLVDDLLARRCTLVEAAAALAESRWAREPFWLDVRIGKQRGFPSRECLAIEIAGRAVHSREDQTVKDNLRSRFQEEFKNAFSIEAPGFPAP
jgi:hypothetical protein